MIIYFSSLIFFVVPQTTEIVENDFVLVNEDENLSIQQEKITRFLEVGEKILDSFNLCRVVGLDLYGKNCILFFGFFLW